MIENEQISFDSLIKPMRSDAIFAAVRPVIDIVLESYNMSPRHVAIHNLLAKGDIIGNSIGFSIAPSQLSSSSSTTSDARSSIFCRIKDQVGITYIEFPANREKHYLTIGEAIETGAAKSYKRINLDVQPDLTKIAQAICSDMEDYLNTFPCDFACCHLYNECSFAGKCIAQNQDLAVGCYYKRNLRAGKVFYKESMLKMIAPTSPPLIKFENDEEKLKYFRKWKLVSPKANKLIPVLYCGIYTDTAVQCEVIGRTWEQTAVISVNGQLHCIDGTYLSELQPKFKMIPRKLMPHSVFLSDYVVLDFETTGYSVEHDSVIEVSAIRYSFNQKTGEYTTLVKNETPINPMASRVNHITEKMLQDAPSIAEVTEHLISFLGTSPLVGHNLARFDLPFLQKMVGGDFKNPYCDTFMLAQKTYPGLDSYKLSKLAESLKLSANPSHRAMQDVEATAELFWKCISRVSAPVDDEIVDASQDD